MQPSHGESRPLPALSSDVQTAIRQPRDIHRLAWLVPSSRPKAEVGELLVYQLLLLEVMEDNRVVVLEILCIVVVTVETHQLLMLLEVVAVQEAEVWVQMVQAVVLQAVQEAHQMAARVEQVRIYIPILE